MAAAAAPMFAGMMSGKPNHGQGQMHGQGHGGMYGQGQMPSSHQQRYVKPKNKTNNLNII